jgi:hypothetical protein
VHDALPCCRFFFDKQDFEDEADVYRNTALSATLPKVLYATANAHGQAHSYRGYVFPPFMVLERGMTLTDWKQQERSVFDIIAMVRFCSWKVLSGHCCNRAARNNVSHLR